MLKEWDEVDCSIDKTIKVLEKIRFRFIEYKLFPDSISLIQSAYPNLPESLLMNQYTNLVSSRKYLDDRWRFIQSEFIPNNKELKILKEIENNDKQYGYFMGLATNPVGLNVGMNKACPLKKLLFTYFHEAGHLLLGIDETKADNFAFEQMYKLKYDDSTELLS